MAFGTKALGFVQEIPNTIVHALSVTDGGSNRPDLCNA